MSEDNHQQEESKPNAFSSALEFWTKTNLPDIQKQLDDQGIEIKEDQKLSLLSRKNLATKTKEFKKLPDTEKLEQFTKLLKLYQNEIDSLTTKLKKTEGFFFDFYRSIAEAPDPKPLLEISLDSVMETAQVSSLKQEVNKLNEELSKKADYNQLKQRLVQTEQKSAETLSTKLKAKEDEFKALIDEKETNWSEKEKLLQKQLLDYKKTIEELKTSNEVTALQLSSRKDISDNGDNLTALAELEIVSRDAEYSKQRLLEVERRNEELRRELSILNNNIEVENIKEELNRKISEMESENVLLIAELEQSRKSTKDLAASNTKSVDNLNKEVSQLKQEISALKDRLSKVKDYEEIKTELQFLRQIEFDGVGDEFDEEEEDEEDINDKTKNKVDTLLIQKNKALNNELITYRSEHESLISKINELEANHANSTKQIEKLTKLNEKLEEDLSKFDSMNTFNDTSSLISGMIKPAGSVITSGSGEDTSSILPIITKQRDRFRDRSTELDNELKKQYNLVNDLKRTVNRLKQDNEELYERTRYLASNNKQRNQLQPKANIDLESNTYKNNYESKLHPIEQFRMREQERISSRLSPFDRIYISLTRAVLATRTTRMLFLFYCLALHFIVMLTTLYSTSINTKLIPEVGINTSTGGIQADGLLH